MKNKINFLLVFLGVLACILFSLFLPGVYALEEIKLTDRTDYSLKHIGIEFSSSCVTLQKLNDSDVCSNSDFVKSMFPPIKLKPAYQVMFDNAEKTDQLSYQKNNIMQNHRSSCIIKNYCNVFDIKPGTKIIYWYDIDAKTRGYFDSIITINADMLHKNIDVKDTITDNGTNRLISFNVNRLHVDSCRYVNYDPFLIWNELGRIIWYVNDNCQDIAKLGTLADPFVQNLTKSEIDVSTSAKWLYLNGQQALKEKYKGLMIGKD